MAALVTRLRHALSVLLTARAAVYLTAAIYVVAGVVLVVTDYTINDEGMLTHYWASWLRRDFVPVFFFQKAKPVLCVLYAAVSAGGPRATLIAHVIVAAAAIPMLAATARALDYRLPNLPALILALSPLYFYGGAAGLSNVDGVVGIVLTLFLLCVLRLPFAAGLVVGSLPWVRFELGVFFAVMAVYGLTTERTRTMLIGMALFPLVYVATGMWYHRDLLWLAHFPPTSPFEPGNPLYQPGATRLLGPRYLLEPVAALTPVAALAVAAPFARLRRIERAMCAYGAAVALTMNVLPIFHIGNFGDSPRYMLHLLPVLALLAGRALEPWWDGERPGFAVLLATALVAIWVATRQLDQHTVVILVSAAAAILTAAWLRASTVAVTLVAGLVLAGPLLPLRTDMGRPRYLEPMLEWLEAHPERRAGPIYTNAQLLAPFLDRRLPGSDIRYVLGADLAREKGFLIDIDNGQGERLQRLCDTEFFAKTVLPPLAPDDLPTNALVVLRIDDPRLPVVFPPATWSPRLEVLAETRDYRIAQVRPAATVSGS
jgi:hypothetical protein